MVQLELSLPYTLLRTSLRALDWWRSLFDTSLAGVLVGNTVFVDKKGRVYSV